MGCAASNTLSVDAANKSDRLSAKEEANLAKRIRVPVHNLEDFHEEYSLGVQLGRGAYAHVCLATKMSLASDAKVVAVKILQTAGKKASHKQKNALLEAGIWSIVGKHPHCIQLHGVFRGTSCCFMVMEKCTSRLLRYIENLPVVSERSLGGLFHQMLQGIAHIHTCGVIHRDVKPENFLLGGEDGVTVKIIDFGLSNQLPKSGKLISVAGTAPFMCPEMLSEKGYDYRADMWSLGVCVYAFLFGTFPYMPNHASQEDRTTAMKHSIRDANVPPTFKPASLKSRDWCEASPDCSFRTDEAVDFVRCLLHRNPTERSSAREALNLGYMQAVSRNSHALTTSLPSLLPMIAKSATVGAFGDTLMLDRESLKPRMTKGTKNDGSCESTTIFNLTNAVDGSGAFDDVSTACPSAEYGNSTRNSL